MITIRITNNFADIDINIPRLKNMIRHTFSRFSENRKACQINIVITNDWGIRKLNKQFLNRNLPTDCLSFDMSDNESAAKLFEIVVNGQMAKRQAKKRKIASESELALYITHGLLHNLGFDDKMEKQSRIMHKTEDQILEKFGYGAVYAAGNK